MIMLIICFSILMKLPSNSQFFDSKNKGLRGERWKLGYIGFSNQDPQDYYPIVKVRFHQVPAPLPALYIEYKYRNHILSFNIIRNDKEIEIFYINMKFCSNRISSFTLFWKMELLINFKMNFISVAYQFTLSLRKVH